MSDWHGGRVGTVAEQAAVQIGGEDPGHRELVVVAPLFVHGRKVSLQIGVGHASRSWP